jgi:hypothetical protein
MPNERVHHRSHMEALTPIMVYPQTTEQGLQQVEQLERQLRSNPKDVVSPDFAQKYIAEDFVWTFPRW